MKKNISDVPDFPHVKKLAEALWQLDAKKHGAAVLIGSGFSRCSSKHVDGTKKLPLWNDFAKSLATKLFGFNNKLTFTDPIRLAEEYSAYFGRSTLNEKIQKEIHDEAWKPGELHSDLLSLPWTEVMTTNWDTLLERVAFELNSPIYGIVSKQSDLASVRPPRIVKLHGPIGVTERFTVTQEDYRRYPQDFSAFVNFARQAFIENELCLLGFSGDDPNFLQWTGWVRDNLIDNTRRIYLVGALNLTPWKRKQLESINIAPIDLWEAVRHIEDNELIHQHAIKIFLEALRIAKPKPLREWIPSECKHPKISEKEYSRQDKDPEYRASISIL